MTARDDLPPREDIVEDANWRVCHSFNSALAGWLVVIPRRHITAIHELTAEEAGGLGSLIRSLSIALRKIVSCEKTYVMQFAESAEHKHVHFHIVPRMAGFTCEQRATKVFTFLEGDPIPTEEMDRIALAVRAELEKI
jgi:diadenosine tetraphosphate (Ap4A) HIT family hydrolase